MSVCGGATTNLYDEIGGVYANGRRTDPRLARRIWHALGDANRVLNVGAGTGNYEPPGRTVIAVEPSGVMRAQRAPGAAPCVNAVAEELPFADGSFDAAMAVLTDHHWTDPIAGLHEMCRVARRVVVFQLDRASFPDFWMVRDYLPELAELADLGPSIEARASAIDATVYAVPIPGDCVDGFFHAYWRRPEAYLDFQARRATSVWDFVGGAVEQRAVDALRDDLFSGAWQRRNEDLRTAETLDVGARLLVASRETRPAIRRRPRRFISWSTESLDAVRAVADHEVQSVASSRAPVNCDPLDRGSRLMSPNPLRAPIPTNGAGAAPR